MKNKILCGDVYACLENLENNSVTVAITSPPYWKQRDYGFQGQIGQEETSEEYIGRLVVIFNKLRQKLHNKGIFFLNIGDKYLNRYGKSHLLQVPYRLAYHMVKDGWILEDIIIWFKPNHMPSSVKDRFSNTYEPVLVFAKNKNNIYKKRTLNIVKIPLQQTPWKHTAVYPENLVREMLNRVELKDGDIILDPFAGTGTTAVVVKNIRNSLLPKEIFFIMIEKGEEFIKIIQNRTEVKDIIKIKEVPYEWVAVDEEKLSNLHIDTYEILSNKYGETFIAKDEKEFLSTLKGITTPKFKNFHREDALFFWGVKNWTLNCLYYISRIYEEGYILRNMIVVSDNESWYPFFMFVKDSKKAAYKFYIDRIRIKSNNEESRDWKKEEFVGIKVRDISNKKTKHGWITKIVKRYPDGFPKIVVVQWDGHASMEFVVHPKEDEFIMEGLTFFCPYCKQKLNETYDPIGENKCSYCQKLLFYDINSFPIIKEPKEVVDAIKELENRNYSIGQVLKIEEFEKKRITSSKFIGLERINWGSSPGARKLIIGEYFTKMRLYRIDQPIIAQFLTILRNSKNLTVKDIIKRLPKEYFHTVGHWFRKDFGGSIPIPTDINLIEKILGSDHDLLEVLKRTALKFQTVRTSIKGKNPGDFIEYKNIDEVIKLFKKLYISSQDYVKSLKEN